MPIYTFPNTKKRYTFSGPVEINYEIPEIISDAEFFEKGLGNSECLQHEKVTILNVKSETQGRLWGVPASHPYFLVSNYGDCITNTDFPHPMIPYIVSQKFIKNSDYLYAKISSAITEKKNSIVAVHRLVAEVFVENPFHKPFVNHIDKNRSNNLWFNLEWVTQKENLLHGHKAGKSATAAVSIIKDKDTGLYGCYIPELQSQDEFNNKHRIGACVFFGKRKDAATFLKWLEELRKQELPEEELTMLVQKAVDVEKSKLKMFLEEKGFTGFYVPTDIRSEKSKDITTRKYVPLLPSELAESIELRVFRKTEKTRKEHFIDESFRKQLEGI